MKFLLAFVFFSSVFASTSAQTDPLCFFKSVRYYEDPQHQFDIRSQTLKESDWKKPGKVGLNFGYSQSTFWIRVSPACLGKSLSHPILEIRYPLQSIQVFWQENGSWIVKKGGEYIREQDEHYPRYRNHLFLIPESLPDPIYVRVESHTSIQPLVAFHSPTDLVASTAETHLSLGLFFGALLILVLINFGLAIFLKERSYFYYSGFLFFYALTQAGLNRLAPVYLWNAVPWLNFNGVPLTSGLMFFCFFFFIRSFLDYRLKTRAQRLFFRAAWISALVAAASPFFTDYSHSMSVTFWMNLPLFYGVLILALHRWMTAKTFTQKTAARLFALSWTPFVIGLSLIILKTYGLIASTFWSNYALQFGSLAGALFFTLALKTKWDFIQEIRAEAERKTLIAEEAARRASAVSELASQVSHDIKSPITALRIAAADTTELPEDSRRLIVSAIQRIDQIVSGLLEHRGSNSRITKSKNLKGEWILIVVDEVLRQKRAEFSEQKNLVIESHYHPDVFGSFCQVEAGDLGRVLSNLINNAREALQSEGKILVEVLPSPTRSILIRISDKGEGIPAEVMPLLGKRGVSTKPEGSGLGLFHAMQTVERWQGKLFIRSELGRGTDIEISLPVCSHPSWGAAQLMVDAHQIIFILDDDLSIHQLWKKRFEEIDPANALKLRHFSDANSMESVLQNLSGEERKANLYLFDLELRNSEKSGLDLIEEYSLRDQTFLVTVRYDEVLIQEKVQELGIKIIPKPLLGSIPILKKEAPASVRIESH